LGEARERQALIAAKMVEIEERIAKARDAKDQPAKEQPKKSWLGT
jgi:BMFP domain-containing protein YqiC